MHHSSIRRITGRYSKWHLLVLEAPKSGGLYTVYSGDMVLYIGTTKNLAKRLRQHGLIPEFLRCGVDRVEWVICLDATARKATEDFLTLAHSPKLCRFFPRKLWPIRTTEEIRQAGIKWLQ